jgi:predicted ATPase
LWEAHPEAMRAALARHDAVVRDAVESAGGYVFKTVGDAFCVAFAVATDGVQAAIAAQSLLASESWPEPVVIRVRMALHTGECAERDGDYFGPSVNRVARLEATAHGGQIVMSGVTAGLVRERLADGVALRDLGEHRLKDLGRTEYVFQVCGVGLDDEFPPLRSLTNPALRHNLPRYSSRFVGRVDDVRAIAERVGPGRLVTLVGPGGTGKTRLAVHAAVEMLDGSGDGVWLVELAPVDDVALVARTVASVLGIRDEPGRPILETLVDALALRQLLLVLDSCEHLGDGVAKLAARVLSRCPTVALLATSREPLAIDGEQLFRVAQLGTPAPNASESEVEAADAVQLFLERAVVHRPQFRLRTTNIDAVAAVCRRVDGIPLAIELAAARLRALSITEILERLDERLGLLTGGNRAASPRQQTLRATIDWSYDLLDERERALFARLAVFAGGWTMAAAEAACSADVVQQSEVLDLLAALVDKSLVELTETIDGTTRYRMLETIREYALDRLEATGPDPVIRARRAHYKYYVDLAEEAAPQLVGPNQIEWLRRLRPDDDNLRIALTSAIDVGDDDAALRLIAALTHYWLRTDHARDLILSIEAVLADAGPPTIQRADALACVGLLNDHLGELAAASRGYERALEIAQRLEDSNRIARLLAGRARIAWRYGRIDEALAAVSEAVAFARLKVDDGVLAYCEAQLGAIAAISGDLDTARSHSRNALRHYREVGNLGELAAMLTNLGTTVLYIADLGDRDLDEALAYATEAEAIFETLELPRDRGVAVHIIGMINSIRGDDATALRRYGEALGLARRAGDRIGTPMALLGCAHALVGVDPERTATLCGVVDAMTEALGYALEPPEDRLRRQAQEGARRVLGDERYDALRQTGAELTLPEAVSLALAE